MKPFTPSPLEIAILSRDHFTHHSLFYALRDDFPPPPGREFYIDVEKAVRRLRKAGLVDFVRDGRATVWSPTEAGISLYENLPSSERVGC